MSWKKDKVYFERTPEIVFALECRVVKKSIMCPMAHLYSQSARQQSAGMLVSLASQVMPDSSEDYEIDLACF